jgi:hypothetical protein
MSINAEVVDVLFEATKRDSAEGRKFVRAHGFPAEAVRSARVDLIDLLNAQIDVMENMPASHLIPEHREYLQLETWLGDGKDKIDHLKAVRAGIRRLRNL